MGYLHIQNLYKLSDFLTEAGSRVYALEKVHGSSANVRWDGQKIHYFSGGESQVIFEKLFDSDNLTKGFKGLYGEKPVTVYGEVYGGRCQKMSGTYGKTMSFIAFDVYVDDKWLNVLEAAEVVQSLGIKFVPFEVIDNTVEALDSQRDRPSLVAELHGMGSDKLREGIVVRPLIEVWDKETGKRLIAKHKRPEFRETATQRPVDPGKLSIIEDAKAIAAEWVTEQRLQHVTDKLKVDGQSLSIRDMSKVLSAMVEDVKREAEGEIVWSIGAETAIKNITRDMFKKMVSVT